MINKISHDGDSHIDGIVCGRRFIVYAEGGHDNEQADMVVCATNNFLNLVGVLLIIKNMTDGKDGREEINNLAKAALDGVMI